MFVSNFRNIRSTNFLQMSKRASDHQEQQFGRARRRSTTRIPLASAAGSEVSPPFWLNHVVAPVRFGFCSGAL